VKDLSAEISALGISGPRSHEVLKSAGFAVGPVQALQVQTADWHGFECTLVGGEDESRPAYEIWLAPDGVRPLWNALLEAGATPAGSEALEMHRIVSGIPRYGVDIRERDLPQETEQARALNFNKGCYVGQEIVERIRSRGAVHRKFSGFLVEGNAQIASGTKIVVAEKEVGEITSVASVRLADQAKTIALGYIRRELGTPGREVMIGTEKAIVIQVPSSEKVGSQTEAALQQHPA
jgi:folate-binding protein YgfZ